MRNILSLSFAQVVSKGLSVAIVAYLARTISTQGFGKIEFARAFLAYFGLIVNLGLDTLGTREVARDRSSGALFVNAILSMRIILACIAYAAYAGVVFWMSRPMDFTIVMLIMGGNLFASALAVNFLFQGLERMEIVAARTVLTSLLTLIGVVVFVKSVNDVWLAALIIASSAILNSLWLLFYYWKEFGAIRLSIDWPLWKNLLAKALPMGASFFMIAIYYNMDMVMLGFLRTDSEVGIYAAAYKVLLLALIPSQIILQAFFPRLSAERGGPEAKRKRMTPYVKMMTLSGFPIAIFGILMAPEIIKILYGARFATAALPLRILMFDVVLVYVNMIYGNPLLGWDKQNQYLKAISAGGIGNAILNILLIPRFGIFGAAIATVLGEVFVLIGLLYFHYATTKTLYLNTLTRTIAVSFITACFLWISEGFLPLLLRFGLGILFYVSLIFALGIVSIREIKAQLGLGQLATCK